MIEKLPKEVRLIYASLIAFFYFFKWIFIVGIPTLYFYLDYERHIVLTILWWVSLALIVKDFVVVIKKKI